MDNFGFWFWLIVCWLTIILAFILLIRYTNKIEDQRWNTQKQVGRHVKIEPSRIGKIKTTMLKPLRSGKPHHLEGD